MVVVPYEAEPQPKSEIRISKFEIRNKFKTRNPNDQNTDIEIVLNFGHWYFGFV